MNVTPEVFLRSWRDVKASLTLVQMSVDLLSNYKAIDEHLRILHRTSNKKFPLVSLFDWFVISWPCVLDWRPISVWNCKGCSDYNYPTLQPSQMKRVREVNGVSSVKWSLHLKPRLLQKQAVFATYIGLVEDAGVWEKELQRVLT